jgi:hypothetical protein
LREAWDLLILSSHREPGAVLYGIGFVDELAEEGSEMPTLADILAAVEDDAGEIGFEIGRVETGLGGGTQYYYRIYPQDGSDYVGGVVTVTPAP